MGNGLARVLHSFLVQWFSSLVVFKLCHVESQDLWEQMDSDATDGTVQGTLRVLLLSCEQPELGQNELYHQTSI